MSETEAGREARAAGCGTLGRAEDSGFPSASACGAGGTRPELVERIAAEGSRVGEKATMADGDRAGASFGDPESSGKKGRGSAIAPASESGQGHEKVGGEGWAQRWGTSAWPSLGATRGLR